MFRKNYMVSPVFFAFLVLFLFVFTGPIQAGIRDSALFVKGADIVLKGKIIGIKTIGPGAVVDAVEKNAEASHPTAVVQFKIDRVVKGEFTKFKEGGPAKLEQLNQALRDKNILKVATLDFTDPEKETEKGWFSVAVNDPQKTFGINSWENLPESKYRIYLERVENQSDSYIMVDAKRIG